MPLYLSGGRDGFMAVPNAQRRLTLASLFERLCSVGSDANVGSDQATYNTREIRVINRCDARRRDAMPIVSKQVLVGLGGPLD